MLSKSFYRFENDRCKIREYHFSQHIRSVLLIGIMIVLSGCGASSKFRAPLIHSSTDIPMYGRTASREFYDSSSFTFPLKIQWEYDASAGFGHGSPVIIGNVLMFGTLQGELHALDVTSGKRIRYIKTFSPVSSSPAIFQRNIIFGTESPNENLISINTENGEVRWSQNVGGVVSSPLIVDSMLFVGGLNGKMYCFEAPYGTKKWEFNTESPIRSSPCASRDLVYCANSKGEVFACDIETGTERWRYSTGNAVFAGLTIANDKLFVGSRDSSLYILEAGTGEIIHKISVGDKIVAAPAVENNMAFIPSLDGTVSAYSISDARLIWKFHALSAVNTTPIITPGAIFVASLDQYIYAISPEDGAVLWKYHLESRIKTTPLVWKNSLIIAAEDKNIYCFQ